MRRSIFKAGVWTAFGLLIAFAIVSANSNARHAATTPAKAAPAAATVASNDECTSSDVCCAKETKAVVAAAPRKAVKKTVVMKAEVDGIVPGSAGMVVAIDPESGELTMPSAAQMQALHPQVMPVDPGEVIRMPNGGLMSTGSGPAEFATIHIDATGKKVFGHADSDAPTAQPAKPALEEK